MNDHDMDDPKHPVPGALHIDASDVEPTDLTKEQVKKALKVRKGVDSAVACLARLTPQQLDRAGITPADIPRLEALLADYNRSQELLPAAKKLVELLFETGIDRGHLISLLLGEIAAQVRRRAARDPKGGEILAPLDELLAYQYGPAHKAQLTRERKAAATSKATVADKT